MNRGHLYKLLLIAFILAWATYSMLPLTGTNLVEVFLEKGPYKPDATYTNIVKELRDLQKTHPDRAYGNLRVAIGTNDIAHYFPDYDVKAEKDPTVFILNRLQKEASGKLKLGLDLIGGSSFLVEMQTNKLSAISAESALENAVEVLRKRVDKFGVAEPLIQKAGANRILIQMPGLSQDTMDSVTTAIQKAAFLEFRMVHDESSRLIQEGIIPPGYEIKKEVRTQPNGEKVMVPYLVNKQPVSTPFRQEHQERRRHPRQPQRARSGRELRRPRCRRLRQAHHRQRQQADGHPAGRRTLLRPQHQGADSWRQLSHLRRQHEREGRL